MNYNNLYTSVAIARALILKLAKALVLILSLQFTILFLLAGVADAPLTSLLSPALRVFTAVAVVILAPRLFDAALRRIVKASRNTN